MTALLPQILEPAGNVVRLGQEAASQIQRKATAKVRYTDASVGYEDTIDPNVPAIPWDSGTGFGPSDGPPTTPGTVDLVNGYTRYVTFIEAGHTATQPMYVAAVADWAALAGSTGGRTLVPLDLWELHGWRYCGPEFIIDQTITKSGTYDTGGGVAVAASTDVTTHGDYGYQDIIFDEDFPVGVVPDVIPASCDPDFVAWVDRANTDNHSVRVYARRLRPLTEPLSGELDLTIPSGANAIDTQVWFDAGHAAMYDSPPVVHVEVVDDPSGADGESSYQPSQHDRAVDSFFAVIFHMPHPRLAAGGHIITSQNDDPTSLMYGPANITPASTTPIPTGGVNGSPSTGNNSDGTDTGASSRSPNTGTQSQDHTHLEHDAGGQTGGESVGHDHAMDHTHPHNASGGTHTHPEGAHDHDTGDHVHRLNNHDHTVDVFPDEGANRTLTVGWTAFGRRSAAATHVPVSWIARG